MQFKTLAVDHKIRLLIINLKNSNKSLQTENSRLQAQNADLRLENDDLNNKFENVEISWFNVNKNMKCREIEPTIR